MVPPKYGPETSHDEYAKRRVQVLYVRKLLERQTFMQELKNYRKRNEKNVFKAIKKAVGPIWYQTLSVPQRCALDSLEFSIYQDLLEGRPIRTARVMQDLGLCPRPQTVDLMNCVYLGRDDPKEMLAQLFLMNYGHTIDGKRTSYNLNARLILSAVYYLGMDNLIKRLRERFQPDTKPKPPPVKPKRPKEPPLASPYLQKMVAVLYERPLRKRQPPPPLPNLDELNEPYEEDPPIPKPPPLPPPPPPPKKRLPRSYCDKLAGIINIEPHSSPVSMSTRKLSRVSSYRRFRGSRLNLSDDKAFVSGVARRKKGFGRKPTAPSTGMWNAQYVITGVYTIRGKTAFVLASVGVLPSIGDLIHGGHRYFNGENINIHCGYRARPPPPKPDSCDCIKKWQDTVFKYVKSTKCYCGHHFDYQNEGVFLPEELPFFHKSTRHAPYQVDYHNIYDLDDKQLYVKKEFKRVWDTDSMLYVDDGTLKDKKDGKKKKKKSSTTCLGNNPTPEDYLKCALRLMRRVNVAARLPDIYLAPELREWMRRRIYGPYSPHQKREMLRHSSANWTAFLRMASEDFGHVYPPKDPNYSGLTTWMHKQELNEKFKKFTNRYKLAMFRAQAEVTNLFWTTMCQAAFPDKKFREIYFSYLFARMEDVKLMHPYSTKDSVERMLVMTKRRYCCPPDGIEVKD